MTPTSGLIEAVPDTISIHALKKKDPNFTTLADFFLRYWGRGNPNSSRLKQAKKNFVRSLAAYSITCYLMQLKDRHNGASPRPPLPPRTHTVACWSRPLSR